MKSLQNLIHDTMTLLVTHKTFKSNSGDIYQAFNKWLTDITFTINNKRRIPQYFNTCLHALYSELINVYRNENCIYCYKVDGVLYTTYNKEKQYYTFKGVTKIKNYRINKKIDNKVLNSQYSESGFYYPCGKPFYTFKESV